jgi:hypothetical protein
MLVVFLLTTNNTAKREKEKHKASRNKKIDPNRTNSKRSTGPKTKRGKKRAKLNALRQGVFMRELVVSNEEKPDFEALRDSRHDQHQPATPLQ